MPLFNSQCFFFPSWISVSIISEKPIPISLRVGILKQDNKNQDVIKNNSEKNSEILLYFGCIKNINSLKFQQNPEVWYDLQFKDQPFFYIFKNLILYGFIKFFIHKISNISNTYYNPLFAPLN